MAQVTTPAGITLEYETAGSEADPPLLMVSGFGAQLVAWPRAFGERLAAGGRFVISYDNRDCGLSSKLDGRTADMRQINASVAAGDFARARSLAPYTLSEMAGDGLGLLDALGIERARAGRTSPAPARSPPPRSTAAAHPRAAGGSWPR